MGISSRGKMEKFRNGVKFSWGGSVNNSQTNHQPLLLELVGLQQVGLHGKLPGAAVPSPQLLGGCPLLMVLQLHNL